LKREIPQKIDTTQFLLTVSTLLRRTRSVSVLGFLFTVSALGGPSTERAAYAAVLPAHLKFSTAKPAQLPNQFGVSRHAEFADLKVSTTRAKQSSLTSAPLIRKRALKLSPSTTATGVSFTPSSFKKISPRLTDELSPLSTDLRKTFNLSRLDKSQHTLGLNVSSLFGRTAIQTQKPILLAEVPRPFPKADQRLIRPQENNFDTDFLLASYLDPIDLSLSEQQPQLIRFSENTTETPLENQVNLSQSLAVLPDIDLSQTVIPNEQSSALIDSGAIVHQVKPGETLEDISRLYQVSAKEITKANRISDPRSIGPDTKLRIPAHQSLSLSMSSVQDIVALNKAEQKTDLVDVSKNLENSPVKKAKTRSQPLSTAILPSQVSPKKQLKTNTTLATRNLLPQVPSLELPPLSSMDQYLPSQMQSGPQKYVWPAKGVLTSGFGWRWGRPHLGIDIAAPIGTPVVAAAPGVVTTAGWNRWGYGNLVEIRHPDGSMTLYAHNKRIKTRIGQSVAQGQQIAEMGSTGLSTGPHTHFELHPSGKGAINPMPFLKKL